MRPCGSLKNALLPCNAAAQAPLKSFSQSLMYIFIALQSATRPGCRISAAAGVCRALAAFTTRLWRARAHPPSPATLARWACLLTLGQTNAQSSRSMRQAAVMCCSESKRLSPALGLQMPADSCPCEAWLPATLAVQDAALHRVLHRRAAFSRFGWCLHKAQTHHCYQWVC